MKPKATLKEQRKAPEPVADGSKLFLQNFLSGGPICRTNVYREAENCGLSWEDVKRAFSELNGQEYLQRGDYLWKLVPN